MATRLALQPCGRERCHFASVQGRQDNLSHTTKAIAQAVRTFFEPLERRRLLTTVTLAADDGDTVFSARLNASTGSVDFAINGTVTQSVVPADLSSVVLQDDYGGNVFTADVPGLRLSLDTAAVFGVDVQATHGTIQIGADAAFGSVTIGDGGSVDHTGGTLDVGRLTINAGGTFADRGGSIEHADGVTIENSGTFKAGFAGSLAGTTGTFHDGGLFVEDVGAGHTNTISMSLVNNGVAFDLKTGTVRLTSAIDTDADLRIDGQSGTLSVPSYSDSAGVLTQTGGTFTVDGDLWIGNHGTTSARYVISGGTVNVQALHVADGSTASLSQTGGAINATQYATVASNAPGAVVWTQSGGTDVFGGFYFGSWGTGTATLNLSGGSITAGNTSVAGGTSAVLNLSQSGTLTTAYTQLGLFGGNCTVNQSGGRFKPQDLHFAAPYGSQGVYNLSGGTLDAGDEYLTKVADWGGDEIHATFHQTGGTNTTGWFDFGEAPHGSATYRMDGGVLNATWFLAVGNAHPDFEQTAGTSTFDNFLLGCGGDATAKFGLTGGTVTVAGNAYVGLNQSAKLDVSNGTFTVGNNLYISGDGVDGDYPSGSGTVDLTGTGTLSTANTFVGYGSDGTLNQSGGTQTIRGYFVENGPSGTTGTFSHTGGTPPTTTQTVDVLKPAAGGAPAVDEGASYTLNLAATSSIGANGISEWDVNWGDQSSESLPGDADTADHVYDKTGAVTIAATALGGGRSYPSSPVPVIVNDVPATIALIQDQQVDTGQRVSISTTFTDPGIHETHTAVVDWGDGTVSMVQGGSVTLTESHGAGTVAASHVYNTHGHYAPSIRIVDSSGAIGTAQFKIDVAYVAPTFGVSTLTPNPTAGTPTLIKLSAFGPESSGVTEWKVNWGDGSVESFARARVSVSSSESDWTRDHTYAAPGTYTVHAWADDSAVAAHDAGTTSIVLPGQVDRGPGSPPISGAFQASFKFGPNDAAMVPGYMPDSGQAYHRDENGYTVGWTDYDWDNDDNASQTFGGDPTVPTLTGSGIRTLSDDHDLAWQVDVPNGTYYVKLVAGDPNVTSGSYGYGVNNTSDFLTGTASAGDGRWISAAHDVTVTDGRLTVYNNYDTTNHSLCYVEITNAAARNQPSVVAPGNVSALVAANDSVDVHWRDDSDNETGFRIDRATDPNGTWTQVGTTAANADHFTDASVAGDSTYYYRVVAVGLTASGATQSGSVMTLSNRVGRRPYNAAGVPWAVNTTIQADDFDSEWQPATPQDGTGGNAGGSYRDSDTDIGYDPHADQHYVGWTHPGEWMEYTVRVPAFGFYELQADVAAGVGGALTISANGYDENRAIVLPHTDAADPEPSFNKTASKPFQLFEGDTVIRLTGYDDGRGQSLGSLGTIKLIPVDASAALAAVPLYNTGVDDFNRPLSLFPGDGGEVDPHYTNARVVEGGGTTSGWVRSNNSRWISETAQQPANVSLVGSYEHDTSFDLGDVDPRTVHIDGQWATDNDGTYLLVNGNSVNFFPYKYSYQFQPFEVPSSMLVPGVNTIQFKYRSVPNGGSYNYAGMDAEMTLAYNTEAQSEPLQVTSANSSEVGSQFTLHLHPQGYHVQTWAVDWGDGTTSTTDGTDGTIAHTYATTNPNVVVRTTGVLKDGTVLHANDRHISVVPVSIQIPGSPSLSVATAPHQQLSLSWTGITPNTRTVLLQRSHDGVVWYDQSEYFDPSYHVPYVTTDLKPDSVYFFRLMVQSATGETRYSNTVSSATSSVPVTPTPAPGAPDVTESQASTWFVALAWTPTGGGDPLGYRVEDAIGNGSYKVLANLPADRHTYVVTGLDATEDVHVRVTSVNRTGTASREIQTHTLRRAPDAPTNVVANLAPLEANPPLPAYMTWLPGEQPGDFDRVYEQWYKNGIWGSAGYTDTAGSPYRINPPAPLGGTNAYGYDNNVVAAQDEGPGQFHKPEGQLLSITGTDELVTSDEAEPEQPADVSVRSLSPTSAVVDASLPTYPPGTNHGGVLYVATCPADGDVTYSTTGQFNDLHVAERYNFTIITYTARGVIFTDAGSRRQQGLTSDYLLTASTHTPTSIALHWKTTATGDGDVTGIERSDDAKTWVPVANGPLPIGDYVDGGLPPGTYSYRLVVTSNGRTLGYSNVATATTAGTMPAPLPTNPGSPQNPTDPGGNDPVEPTPPGGDDPTEPDPTVPSVPDESGPGLYKVTVEDGPDLTDRFRGPDFTVTGGVHGSDWIQADSASDALAKAFAGQAVTFQSPKIGTITYTIGGHNFRIIGPTAKDKTQTRFYANLYLNWDYSETDFESVADPGWDYDDLHWVVSITKKQSVDLAIDSNNDGSIDTTPGGADDSIEDDPNKPGNYIDIDNYDTDNDSIPGFADGFSIAGKSPNHNTDAGNHFTPMQVTVPDDADLQFGELIFTYGMSDTIGVVVPATEATNRAETYDYKVSPNETDGLRLWTKDGNVQRNAAIFTSVNDANSGDFIWSGDRIALESLGFTGTKHTITLYVEAVDRSSASYFTQQPISVTYYDRPRAKGTSDTVNTTAVYNPDGWRVVERADADFKTQDWDTSKRYGLNADDLRAIYNYYRTVYNRSENPNPKQAGTGRMEWAGLAAVAGQSVLYTDSHLDDPVQWDAFWSLPTVPFIAKSLVRSQGLINIINSWSALTPMSGIISAVNTNTNIASVLSDFLKISFRIFDDVGWQLEAYQTAGLDEMKRIGKLNLPVFPGPQAKAGGALVDLVDAWTRMDNPQTNLSGNVLLITQEQHVVAQRVFDQLAGPPGNPRWMINPTPGFPAGLTVSDALTLGSILKEPYDGAETMLEWMTRTNRPNARLTNSTDRFDYFANYLWPTWLSKPQAERDQIINRPLA